MEKVAEFIGSRYCSDNLCKIGGIMIFKIIDSPYYFLFVFLVIMPGNGFLIARGHIWSGLILILLQIPMALLWAIKR